MMDHMEPEGDEGGGGSNPRLEAIMELLKFLAKSEGNRAMPPAEPAAMPEEAPAAEGEPDGDELEALKALAR